MLSRALTIARHDFAQMLYSRFLWISYFIVLFLTVPPTWDIAGSSSFELRHLGRIPWDFRVYIVLLAAIAGYTAIAGERESGTIRLSLGLPGTRRDVVVGKLVSRVALVFVTLVPVLILLDVVLLIQRGETYLATYLPVALWTLLYAVVWTGFAVGVSALVSSRRRVLGVIGITYLSFSPTAKLWSTIVEPTVALLLKGTFSSDGFSLVGSGNAPLWAQYATRLNPVRSYALGGFWLSSLQKPTGQSMTALPNLFGALVLVLFGVLPLIIGYVGFMRMDLGY